MRIVQRIRGLISLIAGTLTVGLPALSPLWLLATVPTPLVSVGLVTAAAGFSFWLFSPTLRRRVQPLLSAVVLGWLALTYVAAFMLVWGGALAVVVWLVGGQMATVQTAAIIGIVAGVIVTAFMTRPGDTKSRGRPGH